MIPHRAFGDDLTFERVNEVEEALGLPLSKRGDSVIAAWDAIAHATGLPNTEQLRTGGPVPVRLSAQLWNQAVDAANTRRR